MDLLSFLSVCPSVDVVVILLPNLLLEGVFFFFAMGVGCMGV